jgi:hypothetical protein
MKISFPHEEELDKLALYEKEIFNTKGNRCLRFLLTLGRKNLGQFTSAFKEFFMIQFLKLNTTAYANYQSVLLQFTMPLMIRFQVLSLTEPAPGGGA